MYKWVYVLLCQAWMEAERSSTQWRKETLWSLPVTTNRIASCGSRPCIAPLASPTSPFHPLRSRNSTPKEGSPLKWTLPFPSSVSSPKLNMLTLVESSFHLQINVRSKTMNVSRHALHTAVTTVLVELTHKHTHTSQWSHQRLMDFHLLWEPYSICSQWTTTGIAF